MELGSGYDRGMRISVLICALALSLTACGSSDGATADSTSPTSETPAKPKFDKKAYGAELVKAYEAGNGRPIKESCDASSPGWQCYFDGVRVDGKSFIYLDLTTPGEISKSEAKAFSKNARLAWFNFVGGDFKKLKTIVTYVNGTDTGTTRRDQVPLLNR